MKSILNLYVSSMLSFEAIRECLWLLVPVCMHASSLGEFDEVVERLRQLKDVKRLFPVLGKYDVAVDLKTPDLVTLWNTVLKRDETAGVVFTETLGGIQYKEA